MQAAQVRFLMLVGNKMVVDTCYQTGETFEYVSKLRFLVPLLPMASKRSLKDRKCVGLLDILGKLYQCQQQLLYLSLSLHALVSHKNVLLINCSDVESVFHVDDHMID